MKFTGFDGEGHREMGETGRPVFGRLLPPTQQDAVGQKETISSFDLSANPRLLGYASFLIAWYMCFCKHKLLRFVSPSYHSAEKYQGLYDGKK